MGVLIDRRSIRIVGSDTVFGAAGGFREVLSSVLR